MFRLFTQIETIFSYLTKKKPTEPVGRDTVTQSCNLMQMSKLGVLA